MLGQSFPIRLGSSLSWARGALPHSGSARREQLARPTLAARALLRPPQGSRHKKRAEVLARAWATGESKEAPAAASHQLLALPRSPPARRAPGSVVGPTAAAGRGLLWERGFASAQLGTSGLAPVEGAAGSQMAWAVGCLGFAAGRDGGAVTPGRAG